METKKKEGDWRKSEKADELREYIDKVFKPKKDGIKNLDREIIVDFIAKEIATARQNMLDDVLGILVDEMAQAHTSKSGKTSRLTSAYNRIKDL